MHLYAIANRIVTKTAQRRRIGWFDYSSDSHDMQVCMARAYRIQQRVAGNRISLRQALRG